MCVLMDLMWICYPTNVSLEVIFCNLIEFIKKKTTQNSISLGHCV
jgi:hypothetical protein